MTRRGLVFVDDESAVLPDALATLTEVRDRGLAHRYVRHVRSSQAFALSLFAPLNDEGIRRVFAYLGHTVDLVEPPFFEYEDEEDRLQEASARSPHRTQVDVLLSGTGTDGRRIAALIEVKLGEADFGPCSAFTSRDNPNLDVCHQPGLFGGEPDRCFQLSNHGLGHRRYADYLGDLDAGSPVGPAADGGCTVRRGRSQPMRNLALAHLLVKEGDFDAATFALCAPQAHPTIWRRFEEFRDAFPSTDEVTVATLPAELVAQHQPDDGAAFFDRYAPVLLGGPTSTALLHLSVDGADLLGVWIHDAGIFTSYYAPDALRDGTRDRAEVALAGRRWPELLDTLPSSSPYLTWWEATHRSKREGAEHVFARVRSERFPRPSSAAPGDRPPGPLQT